MPETDEYDVIVIGTGAGGGTLAHRLAPSGQARAAARARRLPAARAGQLGLDGGLRAGQVPRAGVLARQATATSSRPRSTTTSAATPSSTAPPCSGCARGLRRDQPPRRHLAGLADRLRGPRAVLHRRPSTCTWCTASTARTPPRVRPARSTRSARSQHEPRIQQLSDDLEKQGLHPFHLPIGVDLHQDEHGARRPTHSACIRCDRVDGFPCLVEAKSDAQVDLRRPGPRPTTTSSWSPTPTSPRLETDATGRTVHRRSSPSSADGSHRPFTGRTSSWSPAARSTRPRCCCARPTTGTPNGLANGSDVVGRHYMRHNNLALMAVSKEPNPTRVPEDARAERLVPRARTTGTTRWAASRCSASPTPSRSRARRRAGPAGLSPKMPFEVLAHHAVDFWLCGEDLPLPDNRVTLDKDGRIRLTLDEKNNVEGVKRLRHKLERHARRPGHAPAPPARPQPLPAQGDADRRDRPPGRHGPVRHRPARPRPSTRTARRTSWTTSTSSTPASSRASAR